MNLQSKPAVLTAVVQITRKATGKVEEYVLTGTPIECKTDEVLALPEHTPNKQIQDHGKDQDVSLGR